MDFGAILHVAKKNSESRKDSSSRYYSTKFAPPKKESKDSRLSENIKKFLERQHEEERKKKEEERQKVANLLSMRDEKSKNKIKKMLKVTKSANKSVLDDVSKDHTAVTLEGPDQPDQDDYGYVSNEANAFYQKYIEKVKDVKEDKGFAPSRPQSLKDLAGTKERVKAAITREAEEKRSHSRQSSSQSTLHTKPSTSTSSASASSSSNSTHVERHRSSSKPIYDPDAEKREIEKKKREEQLERAKNRKPLPPPIDFQALLKLAEKKQHEPIEFTPVVKKKEPERLLTLKEKKEMEERQKAKEKKFRIPKEDKSDLKDKSEVKKKVPATTNDKFENKKNFDAKDKLENKTCKDIQTNGKFKTPTNALANSTSAKRSPTIVKKEELPSLKSTSESKFQPKSDKKISKPVISTTTTVSSSKDMKTSVMQRPSKVPEKVVPSKDYRQTASRPFPPPDVHRSNHSSSYSRASSSNLKLKKPPPKRRILDDEDEYDSEMDDFIDDGDCEEDYSAHIREIFGYDKNKYRYIDDDDTAMESNFAQVQREEYISKKIGLQEDLEDMKMEAIEKKRKMMKKKKIA